MNGRRIAKYLASRAKEISTWRGVVLIVTAVGVPLNPAQADALVAGGLALAGILGAFFPDTLLARSGEIDTDRAGQ